MLQVTGYIYKTENKYPQLLRSFRINCKVQMFVGEFQWEAYRRNRLYLAGLNKPSRHLMSSIKNPLATSTSKVRHEQSITRQWRVGELFFETLLSR